jgi:hypothetical protein
MQLDDPDVDLTGLWTITDLPWLRTAAVELPPSDTPKAEGDPVAPIIDRSLTRSQSDSVASSKANCSSCDSSDAPRRWPRT